MFLTSDDLRIKAQNFDLTQGSNILRIIAGAAETAAGIALVFGICTRYAALGAAAVLAVAVYAL